MPMYNLLEYSEYYTMRSRRNYVWNYYRDEVNDDGNKNDAGNNQINNDKTASSKSFEYKTKIMRKAPIDNNTLDTEVVVPLKYLSNCCRFLNFPLINYEIKLNLSLPKQCIISEISATSEEREANPVDAIQTTGVTFQINTEKLEDYGTAMVRH